jgi:hypothetical protein
MFIALSSEEFSGSRLKKRVRLRPDLAGTGNDQAIVAKLAPIRA